MQQIVLLLLHDGDTSVVRDPMNMSPWIEADFSRGKEHESLLKLRTEKKMGGQREEPLSRRRVLKTHAPAHLVPWQGGITSSVVGGPSALSGNRRVIVVSRNPLDVCVSMLHHAMDVEDFEYDGSFPHFAMLFLHGHVESGSYWSWNSQWWQVAQKNQENVLFVTYEGLKINPRAEIRKIAAFIDVACDDALLERVVKGSSFEHMKKMAAEVDTEKAKDGLRVKRNHIRKGKIGSWKEHFPENVMDAFVAKTRAECRDMHVSYSE